MSRTVNHKTRATRIAISALHAVEVHVAGDFNQWNRWSHPLQRDREGRWVGVLDLPPGRHEYKFLTDGHWSCGDGADPPRDGRQGHVLNPLGTMNITVVVQGTCRTRRRSDAEEACPSNTHRSAPCDGAGIEPPTRLVLSDVGPTACCGV